MSEAKITSEMRTRIINKVVRVLNKSHSHPAKKEISEARDRLNFACPYCGDSAHDPRKKRGNIYWDDLYFHCYNCSEHKTLDAFLQDYDDNFEGEDRIAVINYIKENRKDFSFGQSLNFYLFDKIEELALTFDQIALGFNVYRINENTFRAYPYLKSRLLHHKLDRFGYDPRRKELYIFNLDTNNKIIGLQIKPLFSSNGPKYRTWDLGRIYERLKLPFDLSQKDSDDINRISMIFGILQVDMGHTFTVFEGPLDSFFMHNSLGMTGVKKQISEFNDIPTVRYFFDNDKEGKSKMIDKLKDGQNVFMWSKFIEDYGLPLKGIKDLNDLVKYEYKNRVGCLNNLDKYFTNDSLDIVYV